MKDCKIIRDLFPSYIDGLTSETTNQYIAEHLNNCEECKKVLEDMKKDLKLDKTENNEKEVKYIKKFNNKMRILKIILMLILLVILFSFTRKAVIIANLNIKAKDYINSTNYYLKTLNYAGDTLDIIENYKKDDKIMGRFESLSHDIKKIALEYYNNGMINNYVEIQNYKENFNKKVAHLNKIGDPISTFTIRNIPAPFETDNLFQFITTVLFSNIKTEECNEKNCYRIVDMEYVFYIDKETGLIVRTIGGSAINEEKQKFKMISDYLYEFDIVTDDDFIEPDISEYEIQE